MTFASAVDAPRLDPSLVGERCDWNAWVGESDDGGSWSWGACAELVVCTLVRHVVSACEWGGMLAGTLVYQPGSNGISRRMGPGLVDPRDLGVADG